MSLICGLSPAVWKGVNLLFMSVDIIMIAATLNTNDWFKQEINYYGDEYFFYGGLTNDQSGNEDTWKKLSDDCDDSFFGSGMCDQFKNYYNTGIVMIIFGVISACLVGITCFIIALYMFKQIPMRKLWFYLSILSIFLSFSSFLIGFIIWATVVKLEPGDCTYHKLPFSSAKSVCGKEGSESAIATIILLSITLVFYILISRKIYSLQPIEPYGQQYVQPHGEQHENRYF